MTHHTELKLLPSDALADLFAESAIGRKTSSKQLDPELGNKYFDMMADIYSELKFRGIDDQRALLPLLQHRDPDVRCSAAAVALEFAPLLAEPELESIRALHGFVAYEAGSILRQWRAGKLIFPPYPQRADDD